jgi:hypothetical protein
VKYFIPLAAVTLLWLAGPVSGLTNDITPDYLEGKWLFTHIVTEDSNKEIPVNRVMEFLPDGSLINYDAAGSEQSRASYGISGKSILYKDDKGEQKWKVLSAEKADLLVDHRGAQMFFTRQ